MIPITKIVPTSTMYPSQWSMWDDKGNYYYVRFRSGYLRVEIGEPDSSLVLVEKELYEYHGSGHMTFEELRKELAYMFILPTKEGVILERVIKE